MKVLSKQEHDAVQWKGTGESLLEVLDTFPDAYFRIEMDDGKINLSIRPVPSRGDYAWVAPNYYIVFDVDRFYLYNEEAFEQNFTEAAKPVTLPKSEEDWIPYNPLRENIGSDGTRWYDQPLAGL